MIFLYIFYAPFVIIILILLAIVLKHFAYRLRIGKGDYYKQCDNLYNAIQKEIPETYLAQNVILRFTDGRPYAFETVAVTGNGIYLITIKHLPGRIKVHQSKGWSVEHDGWWEVFDCPGAYTSRHFLRSYLRVNGITEHVPINVITIVFAKHHVPARNGRFEYMDGDIRIYKPHEIKRILHKHGPLSKEKRAKIAGILKNAGCTTEQLKQNEGLTRFNPGIEKWRRPYLERYNQTDHQIEIVMKDDTRYWSVAGRPIPLEYYNDIKYLIIHGKQYRISRPMIICTDDGNKYEFYDGMESDDLPFPPEDVVFGYDRNGNKVYTEEYGEFYEK